MKNMVRAYCLSLLALSPAVRAAAGFDIEIELSESGATSLAVYDEEGVLVRTLWDAEERAAGKQAASWDLLDDRGKPVAPGRYAYRTAQGEAVKPHYVATLANGRHPQVPGDLGNVEALNLFDVIVDRDGTAYSSGAGHGYTVQKISPDGKKRKAATNVSAVEVVSALAQDETYIYAIGDEGFYRIRKQDMKLAPFPGNELVIRFEKPPTWYPTGTDTEKYEILRRAAESSKRDDGSNDPRVHVWRGIMRHPFKHYEGERSRGAAVLGDRLLISDFHYGEIRVYDTGTGTLLDTWTGIEKPNGIAVRDETTVLVASDRSIVALDVAGQPVGEIVTEGLERPSALAVGPGGNMYVTDLGIPNRVKVFSPEGKAVTRFGADAPYHGDVRHDKLGIPRGIAVDQDGNIFLSEFALNRVQKVTASFEPVWDLQAFYCYLGVNDQTDPEWIYGFEGPTFPTIRQFHLDYETGAWEWTKVWYLDKFDDGYSFYGYPSRGGGALTLEGKKFLYIFHKGLRIYRIDGEYLAPVVRFGPRITFTRGDGTRADYTLGTAPTWTIWHDLDHDTRVTEDEVMVLAEDIASVRGLRWDSVDANITADGTVYFGNMAFAMQGVEDGIPRYDWNHVDAIELSHTGEALARDGIAGVGVDPDGNRYHGTRAIHGGVGDFEGLTFWARRAGWQHVSKFTPEGHRVWQVGRKAYGKVKNGEFSYMTSLDWAGGCVFVGDMDGFVNVYTDDGLFLKKIFRGTREGAKQGIDRDCITSHELGHIRAYDHPGNGKTYLVSQSLEGGEHIRVFEIEGIDRVRRGSGIIEVAAEQLQDVVAAAPPAEEQKTEGPKLIPITSVLTPPAIDGTLKTWTQLVSPIMLGTKDETLTVKALMRYDEKYLYAGLECRGDESPAMNANIPSDWMSSWKGDCFNLFINTDPEIDRTRKDFGAGDHHIFFPVTRHELGSPLQAYSVKKRDFVEGSEYRVAASGETGWSLTARIPWVSLGDYYPNPGDELHLDVQCDFGNADGTAHTFSLHWGGQGRSYRDPSTWNCQGRIFYAR